MISCKECNRNFARNSNLRAHVKLKHPDKLDTIAPKIVRESQSRSTISCSECNKNYATLGSLRLHAKKLHPDKLEEIAPVRKTKYYIIYTCPYCRKNFQTLKHLVLHKRTHKTMKKLNCPLCGYTGYGRKNLISHFRSIHFLLIMNECIKFHRVEDFLSWKCKIEEETLALFVNRDGLKKNAMCTTINYNCHRSGISKGKNIRKLRLNGSNKIGGYCPARLNIKMNNNFCRVNFCKTHVGHKQGPESSRLYLPKSLKPNLSTEITSDDEDIIPEAVEENMAVIHTVTETKLRLNSSVEEGKKEIISQFTQNVNSLVISGEGLEAVRKIMAPIKQTLKAINSMEQTSYLFPSTSRLHSNKKYIPQR